MNRMLSLFLVVFMASFGYSCLLSVLGPLFSSSLSPLNEAMHLSYRQQNILAGVYLSLYPLGQFLGSPAIGALSDRYGRKKILMTSLILSVLCFLSMGWSVEHLNLWLLAISCFLAGLGESNVALALAAAADNSDVTARAKIFSLIWVTCSLGYIFGALIGGVLATTLGFTMPFYAIAAFVFVSSIFIYFNFKQSTQRMNYDISIISSLKNLFNIFKKSSLRIFYFYNFLFYFCVFGTLRIMLIFVAQKWHMGVGMVSMINMYAGIVALLANFVLFPRLINKYSMPKLIPMLGLLLGFSCIFMAIPSQFYFLWVSVGLIAIFAPMLIAALSAHLSIHVDENLQGSVMGNNQSLQVAAEAISTTLGGILANVALGLPLVVFGSVALGVAIVFSFKKQILAIRA